VVKLGGIKLEMTLLERERGGDITPIVENIVKNRFRWFEHIERIHVDSITRRVYQMEIVGSKEGPRKNYKRNY